MISEEELFSKVDKLIEKGEKWRPVEPILWMIVRLCIVSTFIEGGIGMGFQWSEQRDYMIARWGFSNIMASIFVLENMLGQLVGSALVLTRILVPEACTLLLGIVALRTVAYPNDLNALLINVSICGGLLLLLSDYKVEDKGLFARILSLGGNRPKNYLQFSGRILTVLIFVTVLHSDMNFVQIIQNIIAITLMVAVAIGFKTRLSANLMVSFLHWINVLGLNSNWTIDSHEPMYEYIKSRYFRTLPVFGGLFMIVFLGPGSISIDKEPSVNLESALIKLKLWRASLEDQLRREDDLTQESIN